ncbi:MAG: type VI secretion system baseplate subunit TssE [Burkholderiales bacterium]|nr:type VI secretion system baseplate subunit TssE [Burkholderiales bacterium]
MAEPQYTRGALLPLFDRLDVNEPVEAVVLDPAGLARSIERELQQLLNTRSPLGMSELPDAPRHVINYGLPDFHALSTGSGRDAVVLLEGIRSTIEAFEPRLRNIEVKLLQNAHSPEAVVLAIAGDMQINGIMQRVKFEIAAHEQST